MNLTKEEIKKELYKQKPLAEYGYTRDGCKFYGTEIIVDGMEEEVEFKIPFDDGAALMENELPAQLLIRWLVY